MSSGRSTPQRATSPVRERDDGDHLAGMRRLVRRLQSRLRAVEAQNQELRQICAETEAGLEQGARISGLQLDAGTQIERLGTFAAAIDEIGYQVSCPQTLERMYREACQTCIAEGGFALAWVGCADPAMHYLIPLEVAGPAEGYLYGMLSGHGLDLPGAREPGAVAYRDQRLYVCNDIAALPEHEPWQAWHERSASFGLRSALAMPLYRGGMVFATLTAYATQRNFIDAETVRLFERMADSIELALDAFDLAERQRRDAEQLRQSEERFRTLVENLPLKIFVKGADDSYVTCNALFAHDLGVVPEAVVGKSDFDFYTREQAERFRLEDQVIRVSGKGMDLHENTTQDGIEKIVHIIKSPYRNAVGEIVGVLGAIWDITERKQAELKLRQFAYEVEDIYQNAPCGYHSVDADGILRRINNTELGWLGYGRDEVVGHLRMSDLLSEASREKYAEAFAELKKTGSLRDLEVDMVRKDGCLLPVLLNDTAIYDDDGQFVSSRTSVSDVSVGKELERQQRLQARHVDELSHRLIAVQEEERRRLASELHDYANPNLVAIKLTVSNLADSLPDSLREENREYLDDIQALVEDTTARIREICTELRPPLLDYAGLVPTLESYAQQVARRIGIAIHVDARVERARLGRDVESLLFRIVQEALANCAKHSFARHIRIGLEADEQRTVLTVSDDGVGFEPQALGRGEHAAAVTPGLGLITMKERAEFAGGRLSIRSQPGGGTVVRVEFDTSDRRNNLSRRQSDRERAFGLISIPRHYVEGVERRQGACRRDSGAVNLRAGETGFVERRRANIGRRLQDHPQDAGVQFRFS